MSTRDFAEFWRNHYPEGWAHVDSSDRFIGVRHSRFHGVMVTVEGGGSSCTAYVGDQAVEMARAILRLAGEDQ